MQDSVTRIKNRLGSERANTMHKMQQDAYVHQLKSGSAELHKGWINFLLKDYYDPLYDYSIKKKSRVCIFSGNTEEVRDFLKTYKG